MIKTNGIIENTEIAYNVYTPEREINPKAILQTAFEIEESIAEFMTSNGVVVCGINDGNHRIMYEFMRKKYRRLPYILFGGNFSQYNDADGLILYNVKTKSGFFKSIKSFFKIDSDKDLIKDIPMSLPVLVIGNQSVYDQLADAELNDVSMIESTSNEEILSFINRVYDGFIESKTL